MNDDQNGNRLDLTQWTELEGVPDGGILAGVVGEDSVFVWRNGNRLKAYSANCPHLGGPLNKGILDGTTIRCPWHHACFDLATGEATAAPAFDALPEHVMVLRSLRDCRRILAQVSSGARVAVVGGSFIAMEAAASLFGRVLSIDVLSAEEHPLEKVFGRELSDLISEAHIAKGVRLHLGSKVARIEGKRVCLQSGEKIDADVVVVGIGVEPRLQLAEAAGLTLDRGIRVNSRLQTSHPDIFAAGDIARWPDPHTGENIRVEHWVVAERQGQVAAANMLGGDEAFRMVPFFWTKHFDLSIRYVGHADKWDETLVEGDLAHRDGLVRFRRAGRDLAVATVERDKEALSAELTMEGEFRRASEQAGSRTDRY